MTSRTLLASAVLLALSTCLVSGCGGGGSSTGMVRTEVVPPPPPPPPSSAAAVPCPSPITGNCVVNDVADASESITNQYMYGGRKSDYALITRATAGLTLEQGVYSFAGGTSVENGLLLVNASASLSASVVVQPNGTLGLNGILTGNATNYGMIGLSNKIIGNVVNEGIFAPDSNVVHVTPGRIEGNFRQTSNGTLVAVIGTAGGYVSVAGRADIDGTLRLGQATDNSFGAYVPLPAAPLSLLVLHADGGVFGQFAQWTSPGLFITGAVRYLPDDVYFDATAISAAAAMARASAAPSTVKSATNFDAALGNSGKWALAPGATYTTTQQQFLASVGAIQHLQDYGQATRTFDSLSGRGHTAAVDALLQAALPAADLMSRMDQLHDGSRLGAWSGQAVALASTSGTFNATRAGFDQWLGDRLALGVSISAGDGILRVDGAGGTARDRAPQWDVYLQRLVGADAYVFGDIGYGHHQLDTQRAIDLGIGQFQVRGMRELDLARAYLETGRHFHTAVGELTWFGALSHAMLQGAGFVEQGVTGFELVAQPSTQQRTSALTGLRLGQAWRNGNRVTTLDLAAGYVRTLYASDDSRAAFTGTPDASFALGALPEARGSGWLQLGLGTGNEHWNVGVNYDRQASNQAVMLHTRFAF